MPEEGTYLLSSMGFDRQDRPFISLQHKDTFIDLHPIGKTLSLTFATDVRHCIGWGDIATGERFVCPDTALVEPKYEQCQACQKRTGFNPAFYHASSVSKQQEERNLKPHILYLAYFAPDLIKVGISLASRGNARLLEQGARSALILDTFPSAHIARQYEARIAAMPGFAETVLLRKKIDLLSTVHSADHATTHLLSKRSELEALLNLKLTKNTPLHLDTSYFPGSLPLLSDAYNSSEHQRISGNVIGALGSLLFCGQQETPLFLPIKKYIGYQVTLSHSETRIDLPARQISLF